LPANLDLFALGMFLAVTSAWLVEMDRRPVMLWNRLMPYLSWALAALCFWAVSHIHIPPSPLYHVSPGKNMLKQTLYGIFAFFILIPAVYGPQDQGLLRWCLRSRPVAALGVVSYGVYLWHQAWVSEYLRWTHAGLFRIPWWQILGAVGALAVASATGSYLLLERPVLRLKDRLSWFDRASTARRLAVGPEAR
jgi:peptidoglycan/LPS O-acetylase OafA/YrhL